MSTAYITHPSSLRHEMGPGHPECPERLSAIQDLLAQVPGMALEAEQLVARIAYELRFRVPQSG
jgi:acetoin utilization deacetylase AcuC-like enzyme